VRSDVELLAAWRAGDSAAGEELVARHWTSVSRFCRSKIGDDGADLISQVFLACVEARDRIAGDNLKAYLFAVARKRLAEHFRHAARRADLDLTATSLVDLRTGPATHAARGQRRELLREGLARIPLDDQIALELAYFEGLSTAEIADVLEIAENTVRSRLSRARDKLRAVLAALAPAEEAALAESGLDTR
jgi:RNA polymerase sigma-70 factor (ECF subfamily)